MTVCGDASDADSWRAVMDEGERLGCVWTDPPYGVAYVGKTGDALTIDNDVDPAKLAGVPDLVHRGACGVRAGRGLVCGGAGRAGDAHLHMRVA